MDQPEFFNLPCCGPTEAARLKELPHMFGCDFDLFTCLQCGRGWVACWSAAGGTSGWEWASESDAQEMLNRNGDELAAFIRVWAEKFS